MGAQHEYIIVYCKNLDLLNLNLRLRTNDQLSRYKNTDDHPKGPWTSGDLMANVKGGRYVESLYFPIVNPRTGQEHFPSSNGNWRFNSEKINELINNNEIYFGDDDQGRPKLKRFLCDVKEGITWTTLWDFVPLNTNGSKEMNAIFGNQATFENPKPTGLIMEVIKAGINKGDLILDFFAGSCTTAHAVLALNKEDASTGSAQAGNRKFICVQLPEKCDVDSEAFKAGYKTIAEIGKERIRRVIKKIREEQDGKLDLDGSVEKLDLGFKVFKLQESNFKIWRTNIETEEELIAQMQQHLEPLDEHAKIEDVL
ncbi:MAG: DNA methyltransferase [Smithella sp.]